MDMVWLIVSLDFRLLLFFVLVFGPVTIPSMALWGKHSGRVFVNPFA